MEELTGAVTTYNRWGRRNSCETSDCIATASRANIIHERIIKILVKYLDYP
jgi:hypothetical protein